MADEAAESRRQQLTLTSELLHTFLDWRHRVLTRFAVVVGAVVLGIRHLYQHDDHSALIIGAYAAGAILSFAALLMDRTNQRVLFACYRNGVYLEDELRTPGVFHQLEELFWKEPPSKHNCPLINKKSTAAAFFVKELPRVEWQRLAQYRLVLQMLYMSFVGAFAGGAIVELLRSAKGYTYPAAFATVADVACVTAVAWQWRHLKGRRGRAN